MSIWRVILSILFPPLAVLDKGCGSIIIVLILTLCGWIPGVIAALIIINNPKKLRDVAKKCFSISAVFHTGKLSIYRNHGY